MQNIWADHHLLSETEVVSLNLMYYICRLPSKYTIYRSGSPLIIL